nr:hypothetical protein [Sulfitobacter sp. SK012]
MEEHKDPRSFNQVDPGKSYFGEDCLDGRETGGINAPHHLCDQRILRSPTAKSRIEFIQLFAFNSDRKPKETFVCRSFAGRECTELLLGEFFLPKRKKLFYKVLAVAEVIIETPLGYTEFARQLFDVQPSLTVARQNVQCSQKPCGAVESAVITGFGHGVGL